MLLPLTESGRDGAVAQLRATLAPQPHPVSVSYRSRTGALLRVDGVAAGAFDREHHEVVLPASDRGRELTLEVELEALPTNGLPSGPGVVWWYLNRRSRERPRRELRVTKLASTTLGGVLRQAQDDVPIPHHDDAPLHRDEARQNERLMLVGHSHLDVAWLWTYEQTRRKAERTFAIACDLLDRDPEFLFIQSQPQLYAFVEEGDSALFERVREHVAAGRMDPDVAALWVESDCNVPSGESLLRQMQFAYEYCERKFGIAPRIAWLPDTFGFSNTLPQLLAHAGIPYFSTTKLQWNDTTKFPYPQFVWEGPDGSAVVSALIQSYDGGAYPWRVLRARERKEPLVLGYGDGGGGVTVKMLQQAHALGEWIRPRRWFDDLAAGRSDLPVHRDELYLQYHRGVYTTHHDVKFHNALLERALCEAEELLAWCVAVHAPRDAVREFTRRIDAAWEIVLRNQFHDVLPGTSITPVYDDVLAEYARAEELAASVIASAQSMLPRAHGHDLQPRLSEPSQSDGAFTFDNGLLQARVLPTGGIVELATPGGRNVASMCNVLAAYHDKPKQWEAWNVDASYRRKMRPVKPCNARVASGSLAIDFTIGDSPASMNVWLAQGEPFVRVDIDLEWAERRTLLRVENWMPLQSDRVTYGSPHGTIERSARMETPEERAKFEVPGQRFAAARGADGSGLAIFALDTYGWSARTLREGGIQIGHSLLRGTSWPDERADLGTHRFSYAFAPFAGTGTGALERAWLQFAHEPRVRLFTCDDDAVLVTACKPARGGDGIIVRVRECDGAKRSVRLRCGARMTGASSVDALERESGTPPSIDAEALIFNLEPYQLRSFRVLFSHA